MEDKKPTARKLNYEICEVSSFIADYPAEKILENKPSDSGSRWCSDSNSYPQFITLKLSAPAFLHAITFGKNEKANVCNVRKFEVYGGLTLDSLMKLYEGSLRNDSFAESFPLRHTIDQVEFPVRYVRILPIQAWGSGFNYCIWHVELSGVDDSDLVRPNLEVVKKYRHSTALRVCWKFFRELGLEDVCELLKQKIDFDLESPRVTELYDTIVHQRDFDKAERIMEQAGNDGLLEDFISRQPYRPAWKRLMSDHAIVSPEFFPCMRGGHQMVMDSSARAIYMFGGWDGSKDLSDFWRYDISERQWTLISANATEQNGPSARSCHKMILDEDDQTIFLLGRFVDPNSKTNEPMKSDLYMYDIRRRSWTCISKDTFADGGPRLLMNHQMALDPQSKAVYVCGGKIVERKATENTEGAWYSGLYVFSIRSNSWKCLRPDVRASRGRDVSFKPRAGHCMIFHPGQRALYIFGGHCIEDAIKDMLVYNVDSNDYRILADAEAGDLLPVGFSPRATFDPDREEIHLHFGEARNKNKSDEQAQNNVWVFSVASGKWSACRTASDECNREPAPRYAYQLVYDTGSKTHFLFGGSAVKASGASKLRLGDFWELRLRKPELEATLRQVRWIIRKQKFLELCSHNPLAAVNFLQNDVAGVVDSSSAKEMHEFHQLPAYLFRAPPSLPSVKFDTGAGVELENRVQVFARLCHFFPESMVPPSQNLVDLVQL